MSNSPVLLTLNTLLGQPDAPKVLISNQMLGPVATDVVHNLGYAATGYFLVRANAPAILYDDNPAFNSSTTSIRLIATCPCLVTLLVF